MMEAAILGGLIVGLILLAVVLVRMPQADTTQRDLLAALSARLETMGGDLARLDGGLQTLSSSQEGRIQGLAQSTAGALETLRTAVDQKLGQALTEAREGRAELGQSFANFEQKVAERSTTLETTLASRTETLEKRLVESLEAIRANNASKLEEMRKTVDEKLHATLEQRLGQSFQMVSERLEQVHRGLGEMQNLAAGVGDLKRVLTNVKTRGTWGEVQLEAMIEQVFTHGQYARNIATRPGASERVEIAIRLPGGDDGQPVWLPIDAKFPMEDYQRLIDAHDRADVEQVEVAAKALETRIRIEAKTIREKYIEPPHTTDFAIMYLPTEGLYAEVLRRPGLAEAMQREHRVVISGPTNLAALLNSLQMGFRTLAIERRSSEVWNVLGMVKTEFAKFGEVVEATKTKLDQARSQFDKIGTRQRAIERKLRDVEALPLPEGESLPGIPLIEDEEVI
jgi:DNA recombination protein RmuC